MCLQQADLVEGHVFSRLLYKRYAIDKSGLFLDLVNDKYDNKQWKKWWFCNTCDNERLSKLEDSAAKFFDKLETTSDEPLPYNERFFAFILSIAWRKLMADLEDEDHRQINQDEFDALRIWRRFLFGVEKNVGRFAHHAYQVFDQTRSGLHCELGGIYLRDRGYVYSKLGPLAVVSFVRRVPRPLHELRQLEESRLDPSGGILAPQLEWRIGRKSGNVPMDVAKALAGSERWRNVLLANSTAFRKRMEREQRKRR